jgi:hypothetical protein
VEKADGSLVDFYSLLGVKQDATSAECVSPFALRRYLSTDSPVSAG